MNLTRFQIDKLKNFQRARGCNQTFLGFMWSTRAGLLPLVLFIPVTWWFAPDPFTKCLVTGFCIGVLLAICALAVHATRWWPVLSQVLDWKKVEELIRNSNEGCS